MSPLSQTSLSQTSLSQTSAVPEHLVACSAAARCFGGEMQLWARRAGGLSRLSYPALGLHVLAGLYGDAALRTERTAAAFAAADAAATRLIEIAQSQVGYSEGRNNDTRFGRWYGANNQPWCAMFVSWVFNEAGHPLPAIQGPKGFARVGLGFAWGLANKRLSKVPEVGDIFLISHGGGLGHTGIVTAVNDDGTITTLEGNTNTNGSRNGMGVFQRTRTVSSINAGFLRIEGEVPVDEQWSGPRLFSSIGAKKLRRSTPKKSAKKPKSAKKRA